MKQCFGFVKLFVRQPCDRRADAGVALEPLDFEDLALGIRFGTRWKILPHTFAIQPTIAPKNDLPRGIREF